MRERTERVVRGALQACIHDHGPITHVTVDSAVKRVVNQMLSVAAEGSNLVGVGDEHTDCRIEVEALKKQLRKLRHGHDRLLQQHAQLQQRNADLIAAALHPEGVR